MLKRKMLRDIFNYKTQFISIFLMAFIGVFIFTGMHVDTNSFETSIDNYYEETNLADGWIYSNYLIDEFLYQVDVLGATTQMERQLVVESKAQLEGEPSITLHFVENNTISKFYVIEGEPLDINDSEGVWLDKSFADARNLKIGDKISFESNGIVIKKVIRGFGYSPEYVYNVPISTVPNYNSTGFAYMSYKAFPSEDIPYNVLLVKFEGKSSTFSKLLDYRLEGYYTTFLEKSHQHSVNIVSESITQHKSLSAIFPLIFIIISMLMLSTTIKRIISHQRIQIGILKANGFKNKTIAWHYILPGFLIVTLGSILGAILGPIIIHMIANPSRIFAFKYPYWNFSGFLEAAILIPIIGIVTLFISYFSIETLINEPPSTVIKPKAPKSSSLSFIEKLKIWKKLSFNFRWNYRVIKRNKFRTIMTIFGIIGCTVLLITGLGLYEKINESKDWYFNDVNHFDSKLIIDKDTNISQVNSIAEAVDGDLIMESSIQIFKNETKIGSLLILNDTDLITMTDDNHNKIEIADDEVSISQKMADILDIHVGDVIKCRVVGYDEPIEIKIDKIHSSPFSQGIVMSPNKLKELGLNYTPTSIITSQHVNESYDGIVEIIYLNDLIIGWDEMEQTSMMIIVILLLFAIFLAVIILYNLNTLSFTEMENEISTLKVLGFKSKYLTKLFATQSIICMIIGFLIGIPISQIILSILMPAFGTNIYLVPSISPINLIISFMIILSVSIIMNLYFSRKIKNLDLADSLKSLE